jgi:hypothetical protein
VERKHLAVVAPLRLTHPAQYPTQTGLTCCRSVLVGTIVAPCYLLSVPVAPWTSGISTISPSLRHHCTTRSGLQRFTFGAWYFTHLHSMCLTHVTPLCAHTQLSMSKLFFFTIGAWYFTHVHSMCLTHVTPLCAHTQLSTSKSIFFTIGVWYFTHVHSMCLTHVTPLHAHTHLSTSKSFFFYNRCVEFYSCTQHVPDTCHPSPCSPPTHVTVVHSVCAHLLI